MTANVQISGKASNGIIFVVGGNDVDDFRVNLKALVGDFDAADEIIREATKLITPPSVGGQSHQQEDSGYQPQQTQQQRPTGQRAPTCAHGEREYKSGTSKAGKAYKLWSCTSTDRSDQCEPQWVK